MSTITAVISEWAAQLRYEDIPDDVVHQAKRFMLDSLGCALGGLRQEDTQIALHVLSDIAGTGPCAILGTTQRTDPVTAALANALMIRVMDYNDIYWQQDPSHPSDLIPAALACGELFSESGKELIVGMVLAYEFEMRLCEAAIPGIRERGWHHATLTAFASPIVAARMLRLDAQQMQHAIGISGSRHLTLGAVTAGKLTMMKNTVDPFATQSGVLAALLARRGYTGPEHVIDGKEGLVKVLGPDWKLDVLTDKLGDDWRIRRCGMKAYPTEALTHTPISATLDLVLRYNLAPDDVAGIEIRTLARAADILSDPSKYDPKSKETADHSLPYCIAAALVDRQVTPAQFELKRILDPALRKQLAKIKVVADPAIEVVFPALQRTHVTITTTDGRKLEREIDFPKGNPRNPLTNSEIEEKFAALAGPVMNEETRRKTIEAVWHLDEMENMSELTNICVATAPREPALAHV